MHIQEPSQHIRRTNTKKMRGIIARAIALAAYNIYYIHIKVE
jgi:hypothetical protein